MWKKSLIHRLISLAILLLLGSNCAAPPPAATQIAAIAATATASPTTTAETQNFAPPPATNTPVATATTTPSPQYTATPFYTGPQSPACGQLLPLLPASTQPAITNLQPRDTAVAALKAAAPESSWPAIEYMLDHPGNVGLAAYRLGEENRGAYLNPDTAMPLASVVKLIHLVAYVEAVGANTLNPVSYVPLETLDAYYLPNYDLGSHNRAIQDLRESGLIVPNPDQVRLEDVPWMMVRYSSNAAADYLHLLLGQAVIEQTAVSLNLTTQTAPCTWLGQFLSMSNQTRRAASDRQAILAYLDDPGSYGAEVALLTDAYTQDATFRAAERAWHAENRRPTVDTQRLFSHNLNSHGTAQEYANLMARLAQNGLSNPESSFLARKYLEWPMIYPANQLLFSNLGYKNGSLPGILTTAYYAYPLGETTPIVVTLFYRDLPQGTFRRWRYDLPHDELARWLLADPNAIPLLRAALQP